MTDADQKNVGEAAIEAETPGNVEAVTLPPKEAETVGQGPATSVDSVTEHAESEKVDTAEAKESTEVAKKESEKTETTEVKKLPTSDQRPKRPVEKNIKFDASLMPESNDPAEIRKQVEFYFSDSNLPFDKFLFGLVTKDNKPVAVKLVSSFKRMKRFKNYDTIVEALKESETLDLEGEAGKEAVKRKTPLSLERKGVVNPATIPEHDGKKTWTDRDVTVNKSIYAKGFGEETPTTQVDIEKLFEPYGPIAAVRLRRTDELKFKGSVFVEFATEELQKKFMELEDKPTFNGQPIDYKTKGGYMDGKIQLIKEGKLQPSQRQHGRGRGRNKKFNAYAEVFRNSTQEKDKKSDKKEGGNENGGRGRGRGRGGARGRGRGGRGGRGGSQNGARKDSSKSSNGIPQIQDTTPAPVTDGPAAISQTDAASGIKRKAEDSTEVPETKKAKVAGGEAVQA